MRTVTMAAALAVALSGPAAEAASIYDFEVQDIDGRPVSLGQYRGKVLLIVNVASRCGYTHQYEGLEALFKEYGARGLVVLGFPSNDFLGQEPGSNEQIKEFCTLNYGVSFPMFAKIKVKGRQAHPLYGFLTDKRTNPRFAGGINATLDLAFGYDTAGIFRYVGNDFRNPLDLVQGIRLTVEQLESGRAEVENAYARAVTREGNAAAQQVIGQVFEICDRNWRGIGRIPASGWRLRPEYAEFDAEQRFEVQALRSEESPLCIAGQILQGLRRPADCRAFGGPCTPEHPLGATMVSSEGACAAYYRYGRSA